MTVAVSGLLLLCLTGCISVSDSNINPVNTVAKAFGEITLETIKQQYLYKKYLFIENNTELSDYKKIDLTNVYTVNDVKMKNIDEKTITYILVFEKNGKMREQEYGQLYQNIQNINFFEYKYIIIGDSTVIDNDEIEMQYDRRNKNAIEKQKLFYRAYYSLESFMIVYENFEKSGSPLYTPQPNYNVNKLIALLVNPISTDVFGQFTENEDVMTSKGLLRVIKLQRFRDTYMYLVSVNDNNIQKPFYIVSTKVLVLNDLDYSNTIFEDLWLKYSGIDSYYDNGLPKDTYVFMVNNKN